MTYTSMSDVDFVRLCAEQPDLRFEMTAQGELLVMPPAVSLAGVRNAEITKRLGAWADQDGRGVVSDSSTGFVLPNGARRSPDAAWMLRSRIGQLPPEQLEGFFHLCPDFVIELRSPSDRPRVLRQKMEEWIENGASVAWLLEPSDRRVTIYRAGKAPEILTGASSVTGDGLVEGFTLDLARVWNPLA